MKHVFAVVLLAGVTIVQIQAAGAQSQRPGPQPLLEPAGSSVDTPGLPAVPRGKSTILGGEIRIVDPVRDEFTLKVFGQRPVKILFDERTKVYRDGNMISLRDLGPSNHASVQTMLDGTNLYALSIHLLSQTPEGEYQGRVLSYNPDTHELTLSSAMSRDPIKLLVPASTPVSRVGQDAFASNHPGSSDLVRGALVLVNFQSNREGRGIADKIAVLAIPGAAFVFTGDISALDLHSGILVLIDSIDDKEYQVSFDSVRLQASKSLHIGDRVMIAAQFDGTRYVASTIHAD